MYYVYLIKSLSDSKRIYVGYTTNVKERLERHNSDASVFTAGLGPWELIVCIAFDDMAKAKSFEKYLKSHAGRVFIQKRLL